ncbi:transposase [Streptomyces spiroverticillatus]|uniref:Transposase n=1 Tax=Streptomyces finlayi TaxID=67296 RepID=A0A918WSX2_9ACTN|nr:RNA-guided endonuclease TnpB family protein [Streptomyces finlayi]GGZ88726.1 transposase [Streptomyces spiroverticillatus]GHC79691.1 transposase [Streptomyces finlayi]
MITQGKKRAERSWLGEVSAVVLQQSLRDLEGAYRAFFDSRSGKRKDPRAGPPSFKSLKDRRQSVRFTANARWKITGKGLLSLPKIGDIPVRWSRTLPAVPSTVTVIKDASGRFFASFVIETDPQADADRWPVEDVSGREVGLDMGLNHFAVLSTGEKIASPRFLRRAEKKLRKLQRGHARKQKGSKNKEKSRRALARQHAKVADARHHFHHEWSSRLVREHQAIYAETLNVQGMARGNLAKSIHDAGWSSFLAMLEYKAARYGRVFQQVGRFFPSSQRCSVCHRIDGPKPLHVRTWTCEGCGTVHDRDTNAADNTRQEGRRLHTLNQQLKVAEGHHGDPKRLRSDEKTKDRRSRHDAKKQEAKESRPENRAA